MTFSVGRCTIYKTKKLVSFKFFEQFKLNSWVLDFGKCVAFYLCHTICTKYKYYLLEKIYKIIEHVLWPDV